MMNKSDIELLVAKWTYSYTFSKMDMVRFAQDALMNGYDSNELLELSSILDHEVDNLTDNIFERAIKSIGISKPTKHEAGITIAKNIASKILDGDLSPNQGAQIIWRDICDESEEDYKELAEFIVNASNYDDISDDVAKEFYGHKDQKKMLLDIENNIIQEAKKLVRGYLGSE